MINNSTARERHHLAHSMTAVSKGCDSPAVSVIARSAAVQDAVTISTTRRSAGRLFDLDDCGENVAKQLGLNSRGYRRTRIYYPFEDAVWASVGNIEDVNLTVFDYLQPLYLLFTGFLADTTWSKHIA